MAHKVIVAAVTEPITLADAKLHLRVDDINGSHPDDAYITALVQSARIVAEHHTQRSIAAEQTLEMALDDFPSSDCIVLERPPVQSVISVKYTDGNGVEQTFSASSYELSTYGNLSRLQLVYAATWPTTRVQRDAVRIRYVAGYSAATLPRSLRQAMLLLIGHWYANREAVNIGNITTELPLAASTLLGTRKVWSRW